MNNNTKLEVAKEIMNATIARANRLGYKASSPLMQKLLMQEKELINFNYTVIDNIINEYSLLLKEEAMNEDKY